MFYNLVLTGLSIAVSLAIGTIEIGALIASQLDLSGSLWCLLENVNLDFLGFLIVVMWLVAVLTWRLGRLEERWSAHLTEPSRMARPSGCDPKDGERCGRQREPCDSMGEESR